MSQVKTWLTLSLASAILMTSCEYLDDFTGDPGTDEPESTKNAFITDTSDADTGELRYDLSETLAVGKMSVTISKQATQDGFINLSGTSTSRKNALIDMRIDDTNGYEFTESGTTVNDIANFPEFINDELVDVVITWDATNADGPLVSVTIDGQAVTDAAFLSESLDPAAIAAGVKTVQFRVGGNSSFDSTGAGMLVDNLKVYDTSSGSEVIVFEDDFETYEIGYSLDPDATDAIPLANTPYKNNSFQVTVQAPDGEPVIVEPESTQNAFITDTSDADTGELRLDLSETLAVGKMSVLISKDPTQDGFINLSGTSTSRKNALIDMRINDTNGYEFTESGDTVNAIANFPTFTNNQLVEVIITWDATNVDGPLVTVTIDGQAVTEAAFLSESLDPTAIAAGVKTIQFRLGGNSSLDATNAGMLVDDLKVYDLSTGSEVVVFEDDFESYELGYSLDPDATDAVPVDNSPYKNNSFQVTVQAPGEFVDPVIPQLPVDGFGPASVEVGTINWINWYLSVPIDRADGSGKATSIYYQDIEANNLTDEERTYFDFNADGSFKMNSKFTGYTTSGYYETFESKYCRTELREYWQGNQTTSDNWYMDEGIHELETTLSVEKCEGEGKVYVAQIHGTSGTSLSGTELTAGPATVKVQWFENDIILEYYTAAGVVDGEWTSLSGTVAKATIGEVGNNKFTVRLKSEGGKFYMALYCEATGVDTGYIQYIDYLAEGYEYQNYFKTGNYFRHDEDYTSVSEVTLYSAVTYHN